MPLIYKVLTQSEWNDFQKDGLFEGSQVDLTDGFIHFSTIQQLVETVSKHFAGQDDLAVLAFDSDSWQDDLKWEPSRGGQLFPHLYSTIRKTDVIRAGEITLSAEGKHQFPNWLELSDNRES